MSRAESRPPAYEPTRGRPRSEAVQQAVLDGVMRLLENGVALADVSIDRIARSACVGKAAIYRRWSDKEDLFVDVMRATEPAERTLPGTSMRDDLVVLLESLRQSRLNGNSVRTSTWNWPSTCSSPPAHPLVRAPRQRSPGWAARTDRRHHPQRPTARQLPEPLTRTALREGPQVAAREVAEPGSGVWPRAEAALACRA